MIYTRSVLSVLFYILLHNQVHAQEKPGASQNKIPDSLSLLLKDTDGDGVNDDEDKCINERGPVSNFGCPIMDNTIGCNLGMGYVIFFANGTSRLSPESVKRLDKVVKAAKDYPKAHVQLGGHTDSVGNYDLNMKLSMARMEAVKSYLLKACIDKNRISLQAYGSKYPIDNNRTQTGRASNRRVEITIR
jgi:OmpA-OmpF porin, OOP family